MSNSTEDYSWTERLMVIAILFLVTLVAMQNFVQFVRESEERRVNTAIQEYGAVKSMYANTPSRLPSTAVPSSNRLGGQVQSIN